MPRQANIVSFDAARRAAGTCVPGRAAARPAGRTAAAVLDGAGEVRVRSAGRRPAGSPAGAERPVGRAVDTATAFPGARATSSAAPLRTAGAGRPHNPTPSWYDGGASARPRPDDGFLSGAAGRAENEAGEEYEARLLAALEERERGPLGRLAAKRRERAKERAGKAYFRQYEAGKASDAAQGGPRAAVYKGEMGSSHKRSSRMQQQATSGSARRGRAAMAAAEKPSLFARPPLMGLAATVLCIAFAAAFLYGPAQQLYVDMRERDRLAAEYEAVVERNEALGAQVDALQTDAGIEDAARTQLGWVREGEHAVSVAGLAEREKPEFRGNILSEDIELPETWYSGVLDPLFGVS